MKTTTLTKSDKIHHIRTGPRGGTPVVMLHPVGMDLTLWEHQIGALRKQHDVIALDFPGHGFSRQIEGERSFYNFSMVVSDFIDGLACGPVHLVGTSFGGMVAQEVAVHRPDLVRSLALIGTACTFEDNVRQILRERAEFVRSNGMVALAPLSLVRWFTPEFSAARPDIIDRITKLLYIQDANYHGSMWDVVSALDTQSGLMKLSIPAIIIVGDKDTSTPLSSAEILAKSLKTDNLHIIKDSSHLTILEAPEAINELLIGFFESQPPDL